MKLCLQLDYLLYQICLLQYFVCQLNFMSVLSFKTSIVPNIFKWLCHNCIFNDYAMLQDRYLLFLYYKRAFFSFVKINVLFFQLVISICTKQTKGNWFSSFQFWNTVKCCQIPSQLALSFTFIFFLTNYKHIPQDQQFIVKSFLFKQFFIKSCFYLVHISVCTECIAFILHILNFPLCNCDQMYLYFNLVYSKSKFVSKELFKRNTFWLIFGSYRIIYVQ
eukprot:TRINITY_DN6528_c1_g1_i1.p1 TRINITY_DN6528_c1_g1~~TRINITY_DN6528_c1_g1_i1.p1  ORF type:complete len:220 (+),score=-25.91 TRINITY_DN6528_c1_g1_i1:498-1157(+)